MARAATLRKVAGNIDKITPFATFGANIWWLCCGYKKSTLFTFPVGQTTIGTNISFELAVGSVATKGTYIFFGFVFHFIYLLKLTPRNAGAGKHFSSPTLFFIRNCQENMLDTDIFIFHFRCFGKGGFQDGFRSGEI
jgi:hypothetical protein